ncbi:armadillo-type protein [Copromyces sp. CBS 386.78]|nr:armadillo-type protein [Copromyces sp. CBS 386.78]
MAFTLDKNLLSQLEAAWNGGDQPLDALANLLERIGDGVRDPSLRDPLRESGILDFVLKVLPTEELDLSLKRQCLRVLGNGCADCDENRAKLVESGALRTVIRFLNDRSLLPLLLPVLYNVIVDYEPAQLQVCEAGLSKALVALLQEGSLLPGGDYDQVLNLINNIFELLVSQKPEPQLADPSTPAVFLSLAGGSTTDGLPTLELFNGFCTVALAYLTYESLQPAFLSSAPNIQHLQQAFYNACFSYENLPDADLDDLDQLKTVCTTFVTLLADLSAHPSFSELYPLTTSPVSKKFLLWLSSDKFANQHLRTAACLCLGNLSRSDEASTALVADSTIHVHTHLASLLAQALDPDEKSVPATPQLLHALLSFAKNLAIPQANKSQLGQVFLPDLLAGAWIKTSVQPQVQFAAVSLARLLLVNSAGNVARLCKPLAVEFKHTEKEEVKSYFHLLMTLGGRSDLEPTKIETARGVMSVVRALQAVPQEGGDKVEVLDEKDWTREAFYEVHGPLIAKHLTHLLAQGKYPALRSEVLFVLALLARSTDGGASVVLRVLNEGTEAVKKLAVAVTGSEEVAAGLEGESGDSGRIEEVQDEKEEEKGGKPAEVTSIMEGLNLNPQQADTKPSAAATAKDRENGLVLVAEILRAHSSELKGPRVGLFEEILKKGTELLQNDRKGN